MGVCPTTVPLTRWQHHRITKRHVAFCKVRQIAPVVCLFAVLADIDAGDFRIDGNANRHHQAERAGKRETVDPREGDGCERCNCLHTEQSGIASREAVGTVGFTVFVSKTPVGHAPAMPANP